MVKLLASALSANDAALTQELLALDVPNTMLVRRVGGWGAEGVRTGRGPLGRAGGRGQVGGLGASLCFPHPGPFLPLRVQQLPACSSGVVCECHAERWAPFRQWPQDTCSKPRRETCELGSQIPFSPLRWALPQVCLLGACACWGWGSALS